MTATAPAHIGLRLYRERADRGWSLRQAGAACGMTHVAVHDAEQGRDIRMSTLLALARAYRLSLDVLTAEPRCSRYLDRGTCQECGRDANDDDNRNDEGDHHDH
jgi:transcriptional regulator with XRE-family HTH domain